MTCSHIDLWKVLLRWLAVFDAAASDIGDNSTKSRRARTALKFQNSTIMHFPPVPPALPGGPDGDTLARLRGCSQRSKMAMKNMPIWSKLPSGKVMADKRLPHVSK